MLRGDETESEHEDDDMSVLIESKKQTVKVLQKVKPTISLFK